MIQSHSEQPIEEGKDCVVKSLRNHLWRSNSEPHSTISVFGRAYQCPQGFPYWLIVNPLREIWVSSPSQSSGESIAWSHCDSRWISKPIQIIHQGNHNYKCSNLILNICSPQNYIKLLLVISFFCRENTNYLIVWVQRSNNTWIKHTSWNIPR